MILLAASGFPACTCVCIDEPKYCKQVWTTQTYLQVRAELSASTHGTLPWDVINPGCAVISVKNAFPTRIRMAATPYPLRRPLRLSACASDAPASQHAAPACAGTTACVSAQTARHTRGQWRCPRARGLQSTSVRPYWPKFPGHSWSTKKNSFTFWINGCHKSSLILTRVAMCTWSRWPCLWAPLGLYTSWATTSLCAIMVRVVAFPLK